MKCMLQDRLLSPALSFLQTKTLNRLQNLWPKTGVCLLDVHMIAPLCIFSEGSNFICYDHDYNSRHLVLGSQSRTSVFIFFTFATHINELA